MSDGPSTRNHRITKADFRPSSTRRSYCQAPFCLCALRAITDRTEGTIARLRYALGGDRPSQTTHLTLSSLVIANGVRASTSQGWYFTDASPPAETEGSKAPTYATHEMPTSNDRL